MFPKLPHKEEGEDNQTSVFRVELVTNDHVLYVHPKYVLNLPSWL